MNWTDWLFPISILALVVPLILGFRRRILVRMAFRNALRRPRQSAMIVAGLMVGTAIVAGAQVAGDSMEYSIKKATLDAFQDIDETVFLDAYNFFPDKVTDSLANDSRLKATTDGIGANIIWDAAATDSRTDLYEPSVRLVGYDPVKDRPFGSFRSGRASIDDSRLGPNDAILNDDVAKKLNAKVGDTVTINYTLPQDPIIPAIINFTGALDASVAPPLVPGLPPPGPAEPRPADIPLKVDSSAVQILVILGWTPGGPVRQDLDPELVAPNQVSYKNSNGTTNAPDLPAVLYANGSIANPLPSGQWHLLVHGKAAAQTKFNGTIFTFYSVYQLNEFNRRATELAAQFPGIDLSAFAQTPRHTSTLHVFAIETGGKGPNFQLPNTLTMYVRLDAEQKLLGREGQVNFVKISNPGGVEDGADATDTVLPILWTQLNETKRAFPTDASVQGLRANNDKQFWLAEAERVGQLFGVFLTFVGSFSIIAGLLLIINIFTMLAEERKVELAMARAVGLRRGHLVQLFTFEGVYYALPAAILGTFLGLGLSLVLIWGFNQFGTTSANGLPPIPFRLEWSSLRFAFAVGILLTVATVFLGSRRASRLNIVAAIRSLDEPPHVRGLRSLVATAFLGAVGVAGTAYATITNDFTWQLLGPTFLAIGLGFALRRYFTKERVYPLVALALFAYLTITLFTMKEPQDRISQVMGPVRAITMTLCVCVMVVYTERFTRLLGRAAAHIKGLAAVALVAVSYPLHKKFRTGMTLAMFSVILLVVMLFSIIGSLFAPDVAKESGGYQIEASSSLEFTTLAGHGRDPHALDGVAFYDVLPYFVRYGADIVTVENQSTGNFGPPQNIIYGIDDAFADHNAYRLVHRDPAYASDAAAYHAVARDPTLVIVSYPYSTDRDGKDNAHHVGDTLNLIAKGQRKDFRIIGIQEQFHLPGIFIAKSQLKSLFPNPDTFLLFRINDPSQDEAFAKRIEANYHDLGIDASSIRAKVIQESKSFSQIFTLIRLFLSLGLIVGILSLGIVTARSVIERRQEIGMMRAVGYLRRHIRRTFLMEMLTTVTLGIGIGTAVAILVSYAIWYGQLRELRLPYTIPWVEMLVIAGIAYVTTTLATLSPIFRAARTPPAEALRYIE